MFTKLKEHPLKGGAVQAGEIFSLFGEGILEETVLFLNPLP